MCALPVFLLICKSKEFEEYRMGLDYYMKCLTFGILLMFPLGLDADEIILGFFLITLTGIDIIYREIPNDATQALIIVAIFSIPRINFEGAMVYIIVIVIMQIFTMRGGVGGGDFKLYCSMLVITPGMMFLRILVWCMVYCLLYSFIMEKGKAKSFPMAPFIFLGFLTEMVFKF